MIAPDSFDAIVKPTATGVSLQLKVVPGASRSRIAGVLGDRLKVQVAAPPEGGKANAAVCEVLAAVLGVSAKAMRVTHGQTQPRKTVEIEGLDRATALQRLRASL